MDIRDITIRFRKTFKENMELAKLKVIIDHYGMIVKYLENSNYNKSEAYKNSQDTIITKCRNINEIIVLDNLDIDKIEKEFLELLDIIDTIDTI